jgi:hypothetical protein
MLPKYDLFMFGLTRDDYALSSVSLAWAKEWAKTNRVFYFDRPYSIKDVKTDLQDTTHIHKLTSENLLLPE